MAIVARWSRLRKAPARTSVDLSDVASAAEGDDTVPEDQPPLSLRWLLALSFIGIYSHVFLDYLNNYGVRLLAPIDWRWFYGDAVFIIDLWLWVALGAGVWLARRRQRPVPARGALVFAAGYVIVMLLSARAARDHVIQVWREARGAEPRSLMVGPMPVTPFQRQIIVDGGDHYETGTFSWRSAAVTFSPDTVPKNHEAARGDTGPRRARCAPVSRLVSISLLGAATRRRRHACDRQGHAVRRSFLGDDDRPASVTSDRTVRSRLKPAYGTLITFRKGASGFATLRQAAT